MKKNRTFLVIIMLALFNLGFSQIGINSTSPNVLLEVKNSSKTTFPDGLLVPRLPASYLNTNDSKYENDQNGVIVFVTSGMGISGTKTENINGEGFYYFSSSSTKWEKLGNDPNIISSNYGDIKESSVKNSDHNGWIKLDGRPISSLSVTQQAQASALGLSSFIPNANNLVLLQSNQPLGSINGTNTKNILKNQLPNHTITGTTSTNGQHSHSSAYGAFSQNVRPYAGTTWDEPNKVASEWGVTTSSSGDHSHTLTTNSINGGVTQQQINVMPRAYSVNIFIYLGE